MITLEFPKTAEENIALGLWVAQRIPNFAPKNFQAIAFFEQGVGIAAVALFLNYRVTDMEVVFAADNRRWVRRDLITAVLNYPFSVGCHRLTAIIRKDNKKARKLVQQLGFKQEGKVRRADIDKHDMFIYGLLPEEYRFARKERLQKAA